MRSYGTAHDSTPDERVSKARIAVKLMELLVRHRRDADGALAFVGIEQSVDDFVESRASAVSVEQLRALTALVSVMVSDLQADLTGRGRFRLGDWRVLFWCMVSSRSLREAILRVEVALSGFEGRLGKLELVEGEGEGKGESGPARLDVGREHSDDSELDYIVFLNGIMVYNELLSWLIDRPLGGTLYLANDDVRDPEYEDALPFDVVHGALSHGFEFAAANLDRSVVRASSECDAPPCSGSYLFAVDCHRDPTQVVEQARRMLRSTLTKSHRLLSFDHLARSLELSPNTLRRRLRVTGSSFRELRDDCRKEVGLELLSRTSLSVEEITDRLDYCDADALRVAVRGWVGMAPTEYRNRRT